jgi:NTP pyrophosphatase (non-canonical NTP hydrolase)
MSNPKYIPNSNSSLDKKLGYLIEECGEVLHATGKSIRWGLGSFNPELPLSERVYNSDWLKAELQDLKLAIALIEEIL